VSGNRKRSFSPHPKLFLSELEKHLKGSWLILFTGSGEPFLTPDFLSIVNKLVKMGHKIGVITNFSSSLDDLVKFCKITKGNLHEFGASLHLEKVDVNEFIEKAKVINDLTDGLLIVRSVAVKDKVKEIYNIGERFKKEGIKFSLQLQRVHDRKLGDKDNPYVNYNKEEKNILKSLGKFHYNKDNLRFKGKRCWAGIKYLSISEDGEVWKCLPARRYKLSQEDYLGNVLDKSFKLKKEPDVCRYNYCYCLDAYMNNIVIND